MKTRREFLQSGLCASAAAMLPLQPNSTSGQTGRGPAGKRPNIVFVLADDMGFSDIGCYGSEIDTPNLDSLGHGGLRFTDFHNSPRCCPSRAALLTGLYSHQAGMGMMTSDHGTYPYSAYAGDLSENCVTIAEALKAGGYTTLMAGKWHLTPVGIGKHNYPLQRGLDRYYGIINGAASYFDPASLTSGNDPIEVSKDDKDYYLTDAIGDSCVQFIDDASKQGRPFFLYAAFTAGHWPLMAPEASIAKHKGRYAAGWDALRRERHAKQLSMGIVQPRWELTARDPRVPAWELASFHDWEQRRMEVYAAQISKLDENVGKIIAKLRQLGVFENTMICFMSDNGGNFEEMARIQPGQSRPGFMPKETKDGLPVIPGNDPSIKPGPATTYASYGIPWGNVSNTPFRLYKHYAHEGGISTPFIVHWPAGLRTQASRMQSATKSTSCRHASNWPASRIPRTVKLGPLLLPSKAKALFLYSNASTSGAVAFLGTRGKHAVREGAWKLVSRFRMHGSSTIWRQDRTEMHDLADKYPDRVKKMAADYAVWATSRRSTLANAGNPQGAERTEQ